jgi:hypothetical protein
MSVTTYRSTDSGAPVLNGTTGNGFVNLLTTCLTGTGTAYGSLPKKGWTLLFTGTNKAVYRTVDGVGFLRVVHDGTGTGGFREALVRAAEGATGVDTLVDPFPTVAEVTDLACVWRASNTLDTTARAWELVADDNWFILSVLHDSAAADTYMFGKYSPSRSANSWPYLVSVRGTANSNADGTAAAIYQAATAAFNTARLFAMRNSTGTVKSPRAVFLTESASSTSNYTAPGQLGPPIPNSDGLIFMSPPQLWVNGVGGSSVSDPQSAGFFSNLWSPLHNFNSAGRAAFWGDTFNAAGYDPSAQFVLRGARGDTQGKHIIETTDTWQDPLA